MSANLDRQIIIDAEAELLSSIKSSDIDSLNNLLHDDLLFITPDGQVITKAMDLSSHRSGTMVVEKVIPAIEEIKFIGDTAIVVIVYDSKGKMLGNDIQGKFRYIRFWKLFGKDWKVIGGSCTQI